MNLNKAYQVNKRTPTSLAGQSQENITQAINFNSTQPLASQLKASKQGLKDKNMKAMHSNQHP